MFALVDCNNFFASCERIFNPKLDGRPIVTLSNNDGCIISRSQEAKDLGIPMAAPVYQHEYLLKTNNVHIFSANFSLYGDISNRVMQTLSEFIPNIEIYSIDEAFLSFDDFQPEDIEKYAQNIRQTIKKNVGIPVSIGIAPTKTLAKAANVLTKKYKEFDGVLAFRNEAETDKYLQQLDVGAVWGIGWRRRPFLHNQGIYNALQLKNMDDKWVKKNLTISGLKTVWELRGTPCIFLEDVPPSRKSIISSKSFGKKIETLTEMKEAVATFMVRAAEKLRKDKMVAGCIHVSITTNWHNSREELYYNSSSCHLPVPTSYTPELTEYAYHVLGKIFKPGFRYKKATVMLTNLVFENEVQMNLFQTENQKSEKKSVMRVVDSINHQFGTDTIKFAAQGLKQPWKAHSDKKSPRYTTKWEEIVKARA